MLLTEKKFVLFKNQILKWILYPNKKIGQNKTLIFGGNVYALVQKNY